MIYEQILSSLLLHIHVLYAIIRTHYKGVRASSLFRPLSDVKAEVRRLSADFLK